MQCNEGKRRLPHLARGFAVLCAALTAAAVGSASAAPTETVLYTFCSLPGCSDGGGPLAGLIADSAGNLYGTTQQRGASGLGVVFKLAGTGFVTNGNPIGL